MTEILELLKVHGFGAESAKRTYQRFYAWLNESLIEGDVTDHLRALEKSDHDELVVVRGIDVALICPHHLLPVEMVIKIGYVPNGQVLGLSKFARIARDLSRPIKQEEYSDELAKTLYRGIGAHAVFVEVVGRHSCMRHRGIYASNCETITRSKHFTQGLGKNIDKWESQFLRV